MKTRTEKLATLRIDAEKAIAKIIGEDTAYPLHAPFSATYFDGCTAQTIQCNVASCMKFESSTMLTAWEQQENGWESGVILLDTEETIRLADHLENIVATAGGKLLFDLIAIQTDERGDRPDKACGITAGTYEECEEYMFKMRDRQSEPEHMHDPIYWNPNRTRVEYRIFPQPIK